MNIKLYNYTGDKIVVNKAGWLTNATLYASMDGNLKEDTDLMNPSIVIENSGVPAANYAYIAALGRYYFINNIVCLGATLWRLDMHVDVLMTYAGTRSGGSSTGIYALQAYIDRSAQASGTHLIENAYPLLGNATRTKVTATSANTWYKSSDLLNDDNTHLNYIILFNGNAVFDNGGSDLLDFATLGIGHMITTAKGAYGLMSTLYTQTSVNGKTPADYIYALRALPLAMATGISAHKNTKIDFPGMFNDVVLNTSISDKYYQTTSRWLSNTWTFTVSAPSSLRFFKNYAPYTSVTLSFMPFGKFALDPSLIFAGETATVSVYVKVTFDIITGEAALYWGLSNSDVTIYLGAANVAINLPLMANSFSIAKVASGALNVGTGVAQLASGDISGISNILSGASSLDPASSSVTGGSMQIITDPIIEVIHHDIEDTAANLIGYPDCTVDALYNYTGFTKVGRVHVSGLPGTPTADEIDEVEQLLLSGVEL